MEDRHYHSKYNIATPQMKLPGTETKTPSIRLGLPALLVCVLIANSSQYDRVSTQLSVM